MSDDRDTASSVALRWLRTLRIVRRRMQDSVPPSRRFLLVVTPTDPTCGLPVHVESGGDSDGEHWVLAERGGEVVRRLGVECIVTVHDLDQPDIQRGTVAWLRLDAEGHVVTDPPDADAPEAGTELGEARTPTDAAADPEAAFEEHRRTGEPLDSATVQLLIQAGVTPAEEWSQRGGQLWWHAPTFPDPDEAEDLPTVRAGRPCPSCGGTIVVDATVTYSRVPVYADGTPTDEGEGGDAEWVGSPYCSECGRRVRVE